MARPRISPPPPPADYVPDPRTEHIISAIRRLAAGTDGGAPLEVGDRALALHDINHVAADLFMQLLDEDKESGTTWEAMGARHGVAPNTLQWRVYGRRGTLPQKWAPGVRKTKQT